MINVKELTLQYSNGKGIFNLNFDINEGEVFGYLGPNGAGKTTTIRNLLGFTHPDNGNCTINNLDCWKETENIQKILGYLPGEIAFFDDMTGQEFLDFMCNLRGTTDLTLRNALTERFELEDDRKIKKMSKGMKQKLGIIAAFMHDPKVLILDEPTSGLDPLMQNKFIELINEEKKRGKTILMSSHNFDEVDKTCDRVGIINEGRLLAVENIHTLKANQRKIYVVSLKDFNDVKKVLDSTLKTKQIKENRVQIIINNNYNDMIQILTTCNVTGIDVVSQNLEDIFMHYYGKEHK